VQQNDKITVEASIDVSTLSNFKKLDGIVVLATKSFGNENLSQAIKVKIGDSPIVIMQNGLGVEQTFIDKQFPQIYRCVLFATSQPVSADTLRFKPVSISMIGKIHGNDNNLNNIVDQLNNPYFHFQAEPAIQTIIWKKAIVNSVFNSVCPLLDIDNGVFYKNEIAVTIAKGVIRECIAIANEIGIMLSEENVLENLLMISKSSEGQLISTLQDIKNKRKTEIETLNFSIVDIAKKLNKEAYVTQTRLLGELTKLKSELNQNE
jgi:2-dehydropantoate 2-reductase